MALSFCCPWPFLLILLLMLNHFNGGTADSHPIQSKATTANFSSGIAWYKQDFWKYLGGYVTQVSERIYKGGLASGSCLQVKCINQTRCTSRSVNLTVVGCGYVGENEFLINWNAYAQFFPNVLASQVPVSIDIVYERVACQYPQKNITIWVENSSPSFMELVFWYVAGRKDIVGVQLREEKELSWRDMTHRNGSLVWCINGNGGSPKDNFVIRLNVSDGFSYGWTSASTVITFSTEYAEDAGTEYDSGFQLDLPKDAAARSTLAPMTAANPSIFSSGIHRRDKSYRRIIIGVFVVLVLLISAACMAVFLGYKKDPPTKPKLEQSFKIQQIQLGAFESKRESPRIFSYQELERATDNFDAMSELGEEGFASVYLGKLWDGQSVAVKKLFHDNNRRAEQFSNEIEILSSLNHPNLVLLIGYCQDCKELLLVYEYVSDGTLADHLHRETKGKCLNWETRLNIALGTAQALEYLHFSTKPPILHRDVKSSNILLDHNFRAKVADFGLSRQVPPEASHISTGPQGIPGYLDPDYHRCYQLTSRSDVYSFGVVLAELISAKKALDLTRDRKEIKLAHLVVSKIQSGALHELVDPKLEVNVKPLVRDMVWRMAELAFRCLAVEKDDRPSMMEVTDQLQEIKRLGYGGFIQEHLSSSNSFNDAPETKKSVTHTHTGSPTSVQEK